jgi:predicted nuclease of predicted toxin-antitoxin system
MAPKLLLDEHLSPSVAHRLTVLGFDVTSVRDRAMLGWEDWDLLDWCAREGRALCTENTHDFRALHRSYLAQGKDHLGILAVEKWSPERLLQVLQTYLARTDGADLINQLIPLDNP